MSRPPASGARRLVAVLVAVSLVFLAAVAMSQAPPSPPSKGPRPGAGGGRSSGGARRPPQDGVVKPATSDLMKATVYADNWFAMYINGRLVAVDSIDFLPHNVVAIDLLPEHPMTIAVLAKDNADPRTGCEYGDAIGDGGFILAFADGTVTDASWKAKCFHHGPIEGDAANPRVRVEELPAGWFAVDFDDSEWPHAVEHAESRIQPKECYFQHDWRGARWIWTGDLDLDNVVIFRTRIEKPGAIRRWTTRPDLDASCAPTVK